MELSSEDELRLQVLLANALAIRIDERQLCVFGLTHDKELRVELRPIGTPEAYVQGVRSFLSTTVLGSSRHFPMHLRRWAGLGQIQNAPLDKLLLLGEPEAIYVVACAPRLDATLAARAWWVAPEPEIARQLLKNPAVAADALGKTLAHWLLEYLPFETGTREMIESTRLLLNPSLSDATTRRRLWEMGRRRKAYRIGFLLQSPRELPQIAQPPQRPSERQSVLGASVTDHNKIGRQLSETFDVVGQTFLGAAIDIAERLNDQDEASGLLNAIGGYFNDARYSDTEFRSTEQIDTYVCQLTEQNAMSTDIENLRRKAPDFASELRALLFLAHTNEGLLTSIFARSDAGGSVMRKQIEPVVRPVIEAMKILKL